MNKSKKNEDIYTMLLRFVIEAEREQENPRFLRMVERSFERNGVRFRFEIVPTSISIENVGTTNFYPGTAEEEMETALRQLAVEDNPNFDKSEGTLIFSLSEIKADLEDLSAGKSYSRDQIERSLEVLCGTAYELSHNERHLSFHALEQLLKKEKDEEKYYRVQFSALFLNRTELFDLCFGNDKPNKI